VFVGSMVERIPGVGMSVGPVVAPESAVWGPGLGWVAGAVGEVSESGEDLAGRWNRVMAAGLVVRLDNEAGVGC
jgi:hypothetical protein